MTISITCPVSRCGWRTGAQEVFMAREHLEDHFANVHPDEQLVGLTLAHHPQEPRGTVVTDQQLDAIGHIVAAMDSGAVTVGHIARISELCMQLASVGLRAARPYDRG